MSGSSSPPPDRGSRIGLARAALLTVLATVLYLSCVVCAFGFISLATDTDVIDEPDVGPLIGPVMVGVACTLVLVAVLFELRALRDGRPRWLRGVVTGLAVYVVPPLVAAGVVAFDRVDAAAGLLFLAARLAGPYVPAAAILATALVALLPPVLFSTRRMPRQPFDRTPPGG